MAAKLKMGLTCILSMLLPSSIAAPFAEARLRVGSSVSERLTN
jgi:hypothetical protein